MTRPSQSTACSVSNQGVTIKRAKVSFSIRPRCDPLAAAAHGRRHWLRTFDETGLERSPRSAGLIHGADEVNSISFLPHAFTTLFIIAASLLLGFTR